MLMVRTMQMMMIMLIAMTPYDCGGSADGAAVLWLMLTWVAPVSLVAMATAMLISSTLQRRADKMS